MSRSFKKHYWSSKTAATSKNKKVVRKQREKAVRNLKGYIPNGNWYRKLKDDRWDFISFYGGKSFENYWENNLPRQEHWENIWGFQIKPKKDEYIWWLKVYGRK